MKRSQAEKILQKKYKQIATYCQKGITRDRYIVMTASDAMPSYVKSRYGKVAIVKLEPGFEGIPSMISRRAKGVQEIIEIWCALYIGKTDASEYYRTLKKAKSICADLNKKDKKREQYCEQRS